MGRDGSWASSCRLWWGVRIFGICMFWGVWKYICVREQGLGFCTETTHGTVSLDPILH